MIRSLVLVIALLALVYCAYLVTRGSRVVVEKAPYPREPVTFVCSHRKVEPVTLMNGDVTAQMCVICTKRLPPNWGCTDCVWELMPLAVGGPKDFCAYVCKEHAADAA